MTTNHHTNTTSSARPAAIPLLLSLISVGAFLLSANFASAESEPQKKPWNRANAKAAFTKVLTESARDMDLRKQLLASCDSAKKAVSDTAAINIPDEVFILFFEPIDPPKPEKAAQHEPPVVSTSSKGRDNHNYHIFVLPPYNPKRTTEVLYKEQLRCCYPVWVD